MRPTPRVEVDLGAVEHNAATLVAALGRRGIGVTGVTKSVLGSPRVAAALLHAGVTGLGDSSIGNIERMRRAGITAPMTLIRSPMRSEVERVVASAEVSLNSEIEVIERLSAAAVTSHRTHGIVVMVELGDLREGVMPGELAGVVRRTLTLPNLSLRGIGTNLACQSGASPGEGNMAELSALATTIEATFGITLDVVSGGNSANLDWALGATDTRRIDDLRLGEAIVLGVEPLHRRPLDGLRTDAFTLVAEVIESKVKPSVPRGELAQSAFGAVTPPRDRGPVRRTIVAIGRQDVAPDGLRAPPGVEILGASSDHLVVLDEGDRYPVGAEVEFGLDYGALVRAMTSPFVAKVVRDDVDQISDSGMRSLSSG